MIRDFINSEFAKRSKFIWDFHSNIKEKSNWLIYSSIFDSWFHSKRSSNKKDLIPKRFHHIWLGKKKLPPYFENFKNSWKKNHPDYEFFFWDDEKCKNLNLINRELFDSVMNEGCKSDILRYEILYKYGGIYIDTDFECIKTIPEELLKQSFVACMIFDHKPQIGNGLIMSAPKNKILINLIEECSYPENESTGNILKSTGPEFFTKQIYKNLELGKDDILILPSNYCYPWPNFIKNLNLNKNLITDDSFALHYWGTTWMKTNVLKRLKSKLKSIFKFKT